MANRTIRDEFELAGEWSLSSDPTTKVPGTLRYASGKSELQLHHAFRPILGAVHAEDAANEYPVVHGRTSDGDAVTLLDTISVGHTINMGAGGLRQSERILSHKAVFGAHVAGDTEYREMRFRIPGLQLWMLRNVIQENLGHDESSGSVFQTFRVGGVSQDTMRINAIEACFVWTQTWSSSGAAFSSISVQVSGWVVIQPDAPKTLEWFIEQFGKLRTMLGLLTGCPMSPDSIESPLDEKGRHCAKFLVGLRDAKYCQVKTHHDFALTLPGMRCDLGTVVAKWFEMYPTIHMPSQLAMSVLSSDGLWMHVEFLSLVQALEGFHRGLFEGEYLPTNEFESVHDALVQSIPATLSSSHRDALKSRIRYGNEWSLAKRLGELTIQLPEEIRKMILGASGAIPRAWIDTRNYYTHWDEESRANVLDAQGMYEACVRMRHMIRVLYLTQMGIPSDAILSSLCNASGPAQHLIQLNAIAKSREDPSYQSKPIMSITTEPTEGQG